MAVSFSVSKLRFTYPRDEKPALNGLSVEILPDQRVSILGRSGSGKSTLLYFLGLLLDPELLAEGTIAYNDIFFDKKLTLAKRTDLRLREFGFVLQTCNLLPHFTCRANLVLPLELQGWSPSACDERIEQLLSLARDSTLKGVLSKHGGDVSHGQRQRVAVLRAVVHKPRVIFADEPTSSLDQENTDFMLDLLTKTERPNTLVLVCHQLETALTRTDFALVLDKGQLVYKFATAEWENHAERVNSLLCTHIPADFLNRKRQ